MVLALLKDEFFQWFVALFHSLQHQALDFFIHLRNISVFHPWAPNPPSRRWVPPFKVVRNTVEFAIT